MPLCNDSSPAMGPTPCDALAPRSSHYRRPDRPAKLPQALLGFHQDPDASHGDDDDHNDTRWPSVAVAHRLCTVKDACVLPGDDCVFDGSLPPFLVAHDKNSTPNVILDGDGPIARSSILGVNTLSLVRCMDAGLYDVPSSNWFHSSPQDFSLPPLSPTASTDDSSADDGPTRYAYNFPYHSQCMSPESSTTDTDTDDDSLAGSFLSISPSLAADRDHDYHPEEGILFDHDGDESSRNPTHNLHENLYQLGAGYTFPSFLSHAPTTHIPSWLDNLSPEDPSITLSPHPFDSEPLDQAPCSPHRRLSSLPWDEPSDDLAPLGLPSHLSNWAQDQLPESPRSSFLSLPGADTDDDLIPADLASKNYIPDPSLLSPSTSASPSSSSSLLLFDDVDGLSDTSAARSPPPETIHLSPSLLSECSDDEQGEAQRVHELRERLLRKSVLERDEQTAKWERQRCRELSALLRLKLRLDSSASSGAAAGSCRRGRSTDRASSESGSSPSSRCSSFSSKMSTMPKLVANMVFHRQQDAYRRPCSRLGSSTSTGVESAPSDTPYPRRFTRYTPSTLSRTTSCVDLEAQEDATLDGLEPLEIVADLGLSELSLPHPEDQHHLY